MDLMTTLGTVNLIILSLVLTYRIAYGFISTRSYLSAMSLLMALALGFTAAKALPNVASIQSFNSNVLCSNKGFWWECSGWLFYFEPYKQLVQNIFDFSGSGLGIPASAAVLLAGWYFQTKILASMFFSAIDVIKAFASAFFIYLSFSYLTSIQSGLNSMVMDLTNIGGSIQTGRATLANWGETMDYLTKVADEDTQLISFKALILQFTLFTPFLVNDTINLLAILFQNFAVVLLPLSVFIASFSKNSDPSYTFELLIKVSLLSFLQSAEWLIISFLPTFDATNPDVPIKETLISGIFITSSFLLVTLLIAFLSAYLIILPTLKTIFNPQRMIQ